ncbi:hypothetical protein H6F98_20940 [Microcoleus sp. FACHB-SPT15]|uniref:hypothetical protein n=1 Tax=Microcoleus sp. FACHB-SPT15 TaxID=2692830 RepID=UPI00177A926B|nr:hypothetical protein [Microcoleus sp. FACHB-SPT15]MBD1807898.1 hypothetical protein [Microcoleus sp. FACHB-SPT15]
MPGLSVFLDKCDAKLLVDWLNQDEEIAFLIPAGCGKWQAVPSVADLKDGEYSLWHIPSGLLPLWSGSYDQEIIVNPWDGWTEPITGCNPITRPNSGVNRPGVILLELHTRHQPYSKQELHESPILDAWLMTGKDIIVDSNFSWIGDRYQPAPSATHRWWRRFKYWVARQAIRLTPPGERWSFWAFPSAFQKMKSGMEYYANGWDLDIALREAKEKAI